MTAGRSVLALLFLVQFASANEHIKPDAGNVTLNVGKLTIKSVKTTSPFREEYLAGRLVIQLASHKLIARDAETDEVKWKADGPDECRLQWLGTGEGTI